jgi:superfamily II DNA or RNA helicase
MYCQEASNAALSLYDPFAPSEIWYAEFKKPLEKGKSLKNVILLVDEFHEFMALPAVLSPEGISCPLKLITEAHKVIGLTATFGGG